MGNVFFRDGECWLTCNNETSELYSDKSCVGAYDYNPCWVCPAINSMFCCGLPVWREGGGLLGLMNDGKSFNDPEWDKGTNLRNEFEEALQSQKMRDALLEAPKDCGGGMIIESLPQVLNQNFCNDINEKLLVPQGFRCEVLFWLTYPTYTGPRGGGGTPGPETHMALAIFKTVSSSRTTDASVSNAGEGDELIVGIDTGHNGGRIARE